MPSSSSLPASIGPPYTRVMSLPRTLVIGDVHGCISELDELVRRFAPTADERVVLVGDLVAKGPDSQAVVQRCREAGWAAVLGNHDGKVLDCRFPRPDRSVPKAHHQRVAATLIEDDWAWLDALPLHLDLDEHTSVVHGGALPGVPLHEQERDTLLCLRSIDDAGRPSQRVDGGRPWASLWPGPRHLVFGHDALRGLQRWPHATGLDTGCVYGKCLSGLVLPSGELIQVSARHPYASI